MAYSDFTLPTVVQRFSLTMGQPVDLYGVLPPAPIRPALAEMLDEQVPIATAIHTEKARSELIVAPILMEAWRLGDRQSSFFSGVPFDVSPQDGLVGICDFLLSRSPNQFILGPPVLVVVEAKNDSIQGGLGQCVAEMVAARIYNGRQADISTAPPPGVIHGVVTTGSLWRFLRLQGDRLEIDRVEYMLGSVGKILAILVDCLTGPAEQALPSDPGIELVRPGVRTGDGL